MTKRRRAIATFCLLLAIVLPGAWAQAAESKRPNIIIMYIDDLGYADTSVPMMDADPSTASDFYQTPHLEALAKRGIKFSQGYAPAPTCTPSRKSIQFGKTPARLGYTFVNDVVAIKKGLTWENELSMADVVKAADEKYITAHFGKGMSGKERMKSIGYDITDEYDIGPNGNFHGEYVDIKSRKPLPTDDPKRIKSLTTRSVDFVKEHAGKRPFFLMVSHYAVHVPHKADPKLIEKYRKLPRGKHLRDEDYLDPAKITDGMKSSHWRLQYAAMIDQIDSNLGALVAELESAGELDNTYIIYTSDNGGGLKPNGPLSWGKAQLYEGGLRVPWVVAGPGVKAGVQCDVPVVQWDLLPTLHDLAGGDMPLPEGLDGASLRSVFEKGNDGRVERPEEGLVFHYPCYFAPPLSVIRVGDYKYMKHLLTGEVKLFNVAKDYAEKKNLADAMPEKVAELDKKLTSYLEKIDAEDIQDVYQARFYQLNQFEAMARRVYDEGLARAEKNETGATLETTKARLQQQLDDNLARFNKNRDEVRLNMKASHWAGAPSNKE